MKLRGSVHTHMYIGEVIGPEIKKQPGLHGFMIPGFGARSGILIDVRS